LINTPRAVAFAILELSKLIVLKAGYNFFKKLSSMLAFTDTDSLAYLVESENPLLEMLESTDVLFDLADVIKSEAELREILRHTYKAEFLEARMQTAMKALKDNKGKLGAFKLESGRNCLVEFVGLAPKMYSFSVRHEDGELTTYMKGKGVPSKVLRANAQHDDYRRMLFEPFDSRVSFRKLQSSNHEISGLQMSKRMLTALQDKTFQLNHLESRALGH